MDDRMGFATDTGESIEEQPVQIGDAMNLNDINEVLIRNDTLLKCKHVVKIAEVEISEFAIVRYLLPSISHCDRKDLFKRITSKISLESMTRGSHCGVLNWLTQDGPIFIVKFLPYLSLAYQIHFHRCEIREYNDRRVFVPVEQHHPITTTIYYICAPPRENIIALFITECAFTTSQISHSHQLIQRSERDMDKIELYKQLIFHYTQEIKSLQFHQHLLLLSKWQDIYYCYAMLQRLGYRRSSPETLDYWRCLIMLRKYADAEKELRYLLSDNSVRTEQAWYLLAKTQRKCKKYSTVDRENHAHYSKASQSINMAVRLDPANEEMIKEQMIVKNLDTDRLLKEISVKSILEHTRRNITSASYNILSIDGGGVRGMIPAIWLRLLERATNRTCSSMFQMMAGTSTGAIIAAGLSVPQVDSLTEPAYDASKLVELYQTQAPRIFVKKKRPLYSLRNLSLSLSSEYSSGDKRAVFEEYFHRTTLHDCLTDIVIPVVRSSDVYTHLFSKTDRLYSTSLVDVLMATTAAPTYFKPHCLYDISFRDGGIQMNNPTLAAYTKAIEYGYRKEDIFVLSLGTGDYVQLPLSTDLHWDIMHYMKHRASVVKVLLDSQQHNVDYQLSTLLYDRQYYRWQVWFEEPIELDNCAPDILKTLETIAYEYWEEMATYDDNRLNRLIERLKE